MSFLCDGAVGMEVRSDSSPPAVRRVAMTYEVALVTDRAGSFATVLARPVPRFIEGGRIIVTTLATFDHEREALAYLGRVRWVEERERERMPADLGALERHGVPAPAPSAA